MGPNLTTDIFTREDGGRHTQGEGCGNTGRRWGGAPTSQGTPGIVSGHQKPEEPGGHSPSQLQREPGLWTPGLRLPDPELCET